MAIRQKRLSGPQLAKRLRVSVPTVNRLLALLRKEGVPIHAVRYGRYWRIEFREDPMDIERDPFVSGVVPASEMHAPMGKAEDKDYDGD